MSDTSYGDDAGNSGDNNDLESSQNKKDSEKKRREQENICIEELAMLISAQIPELSDSDESSGTNDASKLEKGSILQDTVEKLKDLKGLRQANSNEIQREEISSSQSVLPKEILGSLVLEALDGFMFIVNNDGKIDFVSDNVQDFLGFRQDHLTDQVIYNFVHPNDHARFSINLEPDSWRSWKRLPPSRAGKQGFDRSKVFHLRFLINNVAKQESTEASQQSDDQYENMQVSAIVMLNPTEVNGEDPKSGLFCIARKISQNERSTVTPVEQFTTKANIEDLRIHTIDTTGLPDLYTKNICQSALGNTLLDLVHPHDQPLIREHVKAFLISGSDTSKVYRMVLPHPQNIVHVKTKSRLFKTQTGFKGNGFVMSSHAIIRENELSVEDLPGLRSELHSVGSEDLQNLEQIQQQMEGQKRVSSPQVQSPLMGSPDLLHTDMVGSRVILPTNNLGPGRGFPQATKLSSPVPVSSPSTSISPFSMDNAMKGDVFHQLLSPASPKQRYSPKPLYSPQPGTKQPMEQLPSNGGGNALLKELLKPKENESSKQRDTQDDSKRSPCFSPSNRQHQQSSSGDNVTLVGLLNESKSKEPHSVLLKQLRQPPVSRIGKDSELAQLLSPGLKRSSSNDEGPASKLQPPSLESMLSVTPDIRAIPPLPRKWSETPQEKLPRDIVIDNRQRNRNNNAGRVRSPNARSPGQYAVPSSSPGPKMAISSTAKSHQSSTTTTIQPRIMQNTLVRSISSLEPLRSSLLDTLQGPVPNFGDFSDAASDFNELLTDPVLSKILDTVDSGQWNQSDGEIHHSDQNLAKLKIHEIEQQLKSVEQGIPPGMPQVSSMNSPRLPIVTGGVISHGGQQQSVYSGGGAGGVIRAGVPQHRILQQRLSSGTGNVGFPGQGPRSPLLQGALQGSQGGLQGSQGGLQGSQGASMEELLKSVPPNVAIKTMPDQQQGQGLRPGMERQLSSPSGPVRHLSGDQPGTNGGQGLGGGGGQGGFIRAKAGRHASGDQVMCPLPRSVVWNFMFGFRSRC